MEAERGLGIVIVIGGLILGRRCAFARGSGRGGRMVWRRRRRGGRGKALSFEVWGLEGEMGWDGIGMREVAGFVE